MTIEHSDIVDPYVHEPKGISTASEGEIYIADGLGSGAWSPNVPIGGDAALAGQYFVSNGTGGGSWVKDPYGFIYFENIISPYSLTYPATFTKIAPTTIAPGVSYLVTEGTDSKLTYLGSGEIMDILCNLSVDQTSGSDRDLQFSIYKNGVHIPGSSAIITTASASKRFISLSAAALLETNDYIECYVKNNGASGDVRVYTFTLFLDPH